MRYTVIGAGSAGCIVAARLSEDPSNEVLLLEGGPDRTASTRAEAVSSLNWIAALGAQDGFWTEIAATRQPGAPRQQYMRGRGVGGSGAVNAMICLPGLPEDYDRWARELGCDGWSWADVEPWFSALKPAVTPCPPSWMTPVDEALIEAGATLGLPTNVDTYSPEDGVGPVYLSARHSGRFSSAEAWLDPARNRPNLSVRSGVWVDRILLADGCATGVRLATGEEIPADHVVLCAGAFESPAILLRTGITNASIGRNLRDHPAASLRIRIREERRDADPERPCISTVLRTSSGLAPGDVHLLPLHGSLDDGASDGVVMAALMTVRSQGTVQLDPGDPLGHPRIDMDMLTDPSDRLAMHRAVDIMLDTLMTAPFQALITDISTGVDGISAADLRDPVAVDQWLASAMGDYFHACGTCRMGQSTDPAAVVDLEGRLLGVTGVHVIDASVLPDVPAANTHWPTVMVAERLTAQIMGRGCDDLRGRVPLAAANP